MHEGPTDMQVAGPGMRPSPEWSDLAAGLRARIKPFLAECPVRLGALARSLDARVLLSTLPMGISAATGLEDGKPTVRINRREARNRQRFVLAHQLAHCLLHRDLIAATGPWAENVLLRSGRPESVERQADRLAHDLVIPAGLLPAGFPAGEDLEILALRYGVTLPAMELGLVGGRRSEEAAG